MDNSASTWPARLRCIVSRFTTFEGPPRRGAPYVVAAAAVLYAGAARAQDDANATGAAPAEGQDEVITDPELAEKKPPQKTEETAPGGEEVISDPELANKKPVKKTEPAPAPPPPPSTQSWGDIRGVLRSRVGVDTRWDREREDVVEATTIFGLEAQYHRSEDVSFAVGIRARHGFGARDAGVPGGSSPRYSFDVAPTAGYADVALADGVHMRAGYQVISLGRFDMFSALNILAVYDLRSGPVTMPEAADVAQPALRLDLEPTAWFTVSAYYVPFFEPDIVDFYGTDYAPFERGLDVPALASSPTVTGVQQGEAQFGRSGAIAGTNGAASAFVPEASVEHPQAALATTVRGGATEVSLTGGTALEHLPAAIVPVAAPPVAGGNPPPAAPARLQYNRFYVVGLDAAVDVAPVQLGVELSYVLGRTLMAQPQDTATATGQPPPPGVGQTDVMHAALRAELVQSEAWFMAVEAFVDSARSDPPQALGSRRYHWYGLDSENRGYGIGAALRWAPEETGLTLEGAAVALNGPTYFFMPRIEYELVTQLYVELGAAIVEGPATTASNPPLGAIFDDVDQVFFGVKWVP